MLNPVAHIASLRFPWSRSAAVAATDVEEDGAAASQRLQKAQDEQAINARKRLKDVAAAVMPAKMPEVKQWFVVGVGEGVSHGDNEIRIKIDPKTGLTEKQLQMAVTVALEKGWKHMYMYDANGKPDIKLAQALQATIEKMGVADRIHCCTDPSKMCPTFAEMKRIAKDPAALAALAVKTAAAATAVAATAAVAHEALQHFSPQ